MGKRFAERIISVLEKAKHDHYCEPEGIMSCPAATGRCPSPRDTDKPCDCGADEINSEIDAMIKEIRQEAA